jgi:hypothetical protein
VFSHVVSALVEITLDGRERFQLSAGEKHALQEQFASRVGQSGPSRTGVAVVQRATGVLSVGMPGTDLSGDGMFTARTRVLTDVKFKYGF